MGCLMNLLWLLLGGIFTAVEYLISSLLMMLTIIGIPFGMQTLKLAGLALWPFGKEVRSGNRSGGCLYILMNILWIFLGGIWICLSHLVFGAILYSWSDILLLHEEFLCGNICQLGHRNSRLLSDNCCTGLYIMRIGSSVFCQASSCF